MNSDEIKKLYDHEQRLQIIEKRTPIPTADSPATIITPVNAFQISTFQDPTNKIIFSADRVIDGNVDTVMYTSHATNPWWCADMGGIYHVTRVEVTNCYNFVERSQNLRVGVTNTKPQVGKTLYLEAYTLCEERRGQMGKIAIVQCQGVSGQYLVVQFRTSNPMNIAEVRIYGYKN